MHKKPTLLAAVKINMGFFVYTYVYTYTHTVYTHIHSYMCTGKNDLQPFLTFMVIAAFLLSHDQLGHLEASMYL